MWRTILDILERKVQEGVDVRLIYDDMGCLTTVSYTHLDVYKRQQLPHPQPDLSSPQPQFVAAKSLMLLPPENVYSSSYGGDRGCVTKQLTEKRNLAIIN